MPNRRRFLGMLPGCTTLSMAAIRAATLPFAVASSAVTSLPAPDVRSIDQIEPGEDVVQYVLRQAGQWDQTLYRQVLGAANEFKEGDQIVGVAAANERSRANARQLLYNTRLEQIDQHPPFRDELLNVLISSLDDGISRHCQHWTLLELREYLLHKPEEQIHHLCQGLSSDVIACVVRLMSNQELIQLGARIFNPLPGSRIGARGYLGARIQPNSPTDHVQDIRWQVFNGFAFAVGDVLLGTNPVSSDPLSVAEVERALQDLLVSFDIADAMPHCVLAHIDVQAEAERIQPGSTQLWFQSIAGNDTANQTFDISLQKMTEYAATRTGPFGLYFEPGQGADFTNGHSHGTDMVLHESRKYGFARLMSQKVAQARAAAGKTANAWVHVNDVAGFIGPEVFRTREQLVRCCLEDIAMGKLHGLTIGLDVCSTLHMDVSLDDLDWCLDQVMPACPAYLMALPTKIDPMLGYLTTGFQDHVRLREKFGCRVNDRMWSFFKELGVIDATGQPTGHFGDPLWVYLQYCRRKSDPRSDEQILQEGRLQMAEVDRRGVFLTSGYGTHPYDLDPAIDVRIRQIYKDAGECIWQQIPEEFASRVPHARRLQSRSTDRSDYILHPVSGEQLSDESTLTVQQLRTAQQGTADVQIIISDGLNALAVTADNHLDVLLNALQSELTAAGFHPSPVPLLVQSGRVRIGYRIGEQLFGGLEGKRAVLHIIGERPGTGHHTLSIYITLTDGQIWKMADQVDHNITRVVSGIATTALLPEKAATDAVRIMKQLR